MVISKSKVIQDVIAAYFVAETRKASVPPDGFLRSLAAPIISMPFPARLRLIETELAAARFGLILSGNVISSDALCKSVCVLGVTFHPRFCICYEYLGAFTLVRFALLDRDALIPGLITQSDIDSFTCELFLYNLLY